MFKPDFKIAKGRPRPKVQPASYPFSSLGHKESLMQMYGLSTNYPVVFALMPVIPPIEMTASFLLFFLPLYPQPMGWAESPDPAYFYPASAGFFNCQTRTSAF